MVPGENRIAGLLRPRQRLARNGRLVDRRGPRGHTPVGENPVARPDPDPFSGQEPCNCDGFGCAVRPEPVRRLRRQLDQPGDRAAPAVHGEPLQQLGGGEEKRQSRGLERLSNEDRGDHGDGHEEVHVQAERSRRPNGGAEEVGPADRGGGGVEQTRGVEPQPEPTGLVRRCGSPAPHHPCGPQQAGCVRAAREG